MEAKDVLENVQKIMRRVFNNDSIVITMETTASDIDEWTSLTQMQLIDEEEKVFNLKFKLKEILKWKNVGDMVMCVVERSVK